MQVMETKNEAVQEGLYEEASILRRREIDYCSELSGPPREGSSLPVVSCEDIEAVVSSWTGVPVEKLTQDDRDKLLSLVRGKRD